MSAYKKLSKSDTFITPFIANKEWSFNSPSFSFDDNIKIFKGTNLTCSFDINGPINTDLSYEKLVYDEINHLFYQKYTKALNTQSLASSIHYESASIYRPTSSYFIYDENSGIIKQFPTGANEIIRVLSVNPKVYGNKIKPGTFRYQNEFSNIVLYDDSNGNVIVNDVYFGEYSGYVGNIFYNHGLVIITDQTYVNIFPDTPIAYSDNALFYSSSLKTVNVLGNDYVGVGNFNTSSIELFSPTGSFITSSGMIICNNTIPGNYSVLYSFRNQMGLKSNKARLNVGVISDLVNYASSSFRIFNDSVTSGSLITTNSIWSVSFIDGATYQSYFSDTIKIGQSHSFDYTGSLNTSILGVSFVGTNFNNTPFTYLLYKVENNELIYNSNFTDSEATVNGVPAQKDYILYITTPLP